MNLFQTKRFTMHSGGISDFKLECDAITLEDYKTLALVVSKKIKFQKCYGIPKGGIPFAECLEVYEDPSSDKILIADDVLTTGRSFITMKQELMDKYGYKPEQIIGITVFARGPCPDYITPIFTMNSDFWQND